MSIDFEMALDLKDESFFSKAILESIFFDGVFLMPLSLSMALAWLTLNVLRLALAPPGTVELLGVGDFLFVDFCKLYSLGNNYSLYSSFKDSIGYFLTGVLLIPSGKVALTGDVFIKSLNIFIPLLAF